jgi:hypothetical protein
MALAFPLWLYGRSLILSSILRGGFGCYPVMPIHLVLDLLELFLYTIGLFFFLRITRWVVVIILCLQVVFLSLSGPVDALAGATIRSIKTVIKIAIRYLKTRQLKALIEFPCFFETLSVSSK